jgi:hypothetical protein
MSARSTLKRIAKKLLTILGIIAICIIAVFAAAVYLFTLPFKNL